MRLEFDFWQILVQKFFSPTVGLGLELLQRSSCLPSSLVRIVLRNRTWLADQFRFASLLDLHKEAVHIDESDHRLFGHFDFW